MNTFSRGVRNAFRNQIRTFSIVIILGLSIGLTLSMLMARKAVENKITSVKNSIGNTITVSPAGERGFQGGGEPLTNTQLAKVAAMPNVTKVDEILSDRLTSDNTNLVSAIDAGSLGNRQAANAGIGFSVQQNRQSRFADNPQITRTFTPPVIITGTNDTSNSAIYGGNSVKFLSGQALDSTKDSNKATVGKTLASKNNLSVGSTFTAYGTTVTVTGIYDAGNTFANAGAVFSLPSLQRLSSQANDITSATVTVNSIDNVDSVVASAKKILGSTADIVSEQDSAKQAIAPLENVKTISLYSLVGALIAGAVIILLTMVMIVRERRREIGVMKAIGASNVRIMIQFISEAVTLTVLGLVVGLILGIVAATPITNALVTNSASNTTAMTNQTQPDAQSRAGGFGRARQFQRSFRNFQNNSTVNIRNIQTSIGLQTLSEGVGAALIIAIVGSALPAILISKIQPAEVMRTE